MTAPQVVATIVVLISAGSATALAIMATASALLEMSVEARDRWGRSGRGSRRAASPTGYPPGSPRYRIPVRPAGSGRKPAGAHRLDRRRDSPVALESGRAVRGGLRLRRRLPLADRRPSGTRSRRGDNRELHGLRGVCRPRCLRPLCGPRGPDAVPARPGGLSGATRDLRSEALDRLDSLDGHSRHRDGGDPASARDRARGRSPRRCVPSLDELRATRRAAEPGPRRSSILDGGYRNARGIPGAVRGGRARLVRSERRSPVMRPRSVRVQAVFDRRGRTDSGLPNPRDRYRFGNPFNLRRLNGGRDRDRTCD